MHPMIWLGIALLVLWGLAWLVFKVVGFAVHLLLIAAVPLRGLGTGEAGARKVGL
jgi:hypothetical protein